MTRAVVLTGGPGHDFAATTALLCALLDDAGLRVEQHRHVDDAFAALREPAALLVVDALFWTMREPERYRGRAAAEGVSPSPSSRTALAAHLGSGGGLLGVHTAALCFDDWPGWAGALGGAWVWGRSHHPPAGPLDVRSTGPHPLTCGVEEFRVDDELYSDLDVAPDVVPLLVAGGEPVLWARGHGGGRVVYDALGHHPPSYDVPEHREILRRAIRWTAGG